MRKRTTTTEERFFAKVTERGECWEFGSLNPEGYGQFALESRVPVMAHRWSYEFFVGQIPPGLHIDHLCRNRACVNPGHLEPVTRHENILRGESFAATNAVKDECLRGHPFDAANTYHHPQRGSRVCRACQRERTRAYEQRKRDQARASI